MLGRAPFRYAVSARANRFLIITSTLSILALYLNHPFLCLGLLPLHPPIVYADQGQEIMLILDYAHFLPVQINEDTAEVGQQVKVLVNYTTMDPSVLGQRINAVMKVYTTDKTVTQSDSYQDIQDFCNALKQGEFKTAEDMAALLGYGSVSTAAELLCTLTTSEEGVEQNSQQSPVLIKTSSFPAGFIANSSDAQLLGTTITNSNGELERVTAVVQFTDAEKIVPMSNSVIVNLTNGDRVEK